MKLSNIQQYSVVTANYWAFTLTDGAKQFVVQDAAVTNLCLEGS